MDDETIDPLTIARMLSTVLSARLDDFHAETITLSRDEAVLSLGVINATVEMLEQEHGGTRH